MTATTRRFESAARGPRRWMRTPVLGGLIACVLALVGLSAVPAHAAVTATWTGAGSTDLWSNPDNWSGHVVPGAGDTAVVQAISGQTVNVLPEGAVTVGTLKLLGGENDTRIGNDGVGSLTVTGSMTWTGGEVGVPLAIPAGSTLTFGTGSDKDFSPATGGQITVGGTAVVDHTGTADGDEIQFYWDSGITITPGGVLRSHGDSQIFGNRCCGADLPSAVDNGGTVDVPDGHLTIKDMGLYLHGAVHVGTGATLTDDRGLGRLGNTTYSGAGHLEFSNTEGPGPNPVHPELNQGGALLLGTGTFADDFELGLLGGTELTGVGSFTGRGHVTLGGATIYAKVGLAGSTYLDASSGSHSWLASWDRDVTGYHGDVTLADGGAVEPGGQLSINHDARMTVSGGTFAIGQAGMLDSGSCCTDAPGLVIGSKGAVAFHGNSSSETATMKWLTVANSGSLQATSWTTWSGDTITQSAGQTTIGSQVATDRTDFTVRGGTVTGAGTYAGDIDNAGGTVRPSGILHIGGDYTQGSHGTLAVTAGSSRTSLVVAGDAALAGNLTVVTRGTTAAGAKQRIVSAATRTGTFGCAKASRWLPAYDGRGVSLTRVTVATPGCAYATAATNRLSKAVKAGKAASFKATFGAHARMVLLQVRVSKASRTTKVKLSSGGSRHAKLEAKRHHTTTKYVLVRVASKHKIKVTAGKGHVRVRIRQVAWYR